MALLLLVEDDAAIAGPLIRALERAGHSTRWVTTGGESEIAVYESEPELVVLDLGLPDIDGLDVCRRLRSSHELLPIIVLTARREELDIVEGFEAGADDYMTKPFRLSELLARIRARLRAVTATRLESEGIAVDVAARRAWQADRELGLSTKEFDLLVELVRGAGTVVKREQLMDKVWGTDFVGSTKTLDVHMAWLRRKLGDDATAPRYITTVRGIGYRFEGPASSR
jgi:DNA-binding response OmpR family regulator